MGNKRERGFTLIELMLVVAILGVLAALILPRIGESLKDSRVNTCRANLRGIKSQLELYKFKVLSQYPVNQAAFDLLLTDKGWFKEIPDCPDAAVNSYVYTRIPGPPEDFTVTCTDTKGEGHNP